MSKSKNPKGLLEIRVPWMAPKTRKDHVPLRRGRCSTSGRVLDLSLPTSRDLQGYSWKLFILRAGQSGCTLVAQTAPENSGATGCAVDHNRLGARFAMDVDVTFDGSPGRVRFSTPRPSGFEAACHGSGRFALVHTAKTKTEFPWESKTKKEFIVCKGVSFASVGQNVVFGLLEGML